MARGPGRVWGRVGTRGCVLVGGVALFAAVIGGVRAGVAGCAATGRGPVLAASAIDEAWEATLPRADGWNGGDIAHTIDAGERTVWLFGDSIFGPVVDGRRVGDRSRMVRGAIAWHATGAEPPREVRFAAPEPLRGVGSASWIAPAPGLWPEGTWYWLMNDAARVGDRLLLFATAVGPSGNPDGMWNFRRVGGAILEVANPGDEPTAWRVTQRRNPRVGEDPRHGEPAKESENHALAIVRDGLVYLFGVLYGADGGKSMIVARSRVEGVGAPEGWEVFDGRTWGAGPAAVVIPGVADEFTVHAIRRGGRTMLVQVQAEAFLSRRIVARTSWRPEGPWSGPATVYDAPDPGPTAFIYAAKAHPTLSRPGELLVTYAVNAEFGRVFEDARLYRPKFVRVPTRLLPEPPG